MRIILFLAFIMSLNSQAQQRPGGSGIVVDQMKMEYLYRFSLIFWK
jgi:hypothetical protein